MLLNSTESFDGMQKHRLRVSALKSFLVGIGRLLHDHDDLSATGKWRMCSLNAQSHVISATPTALALGVCVWFMGGYCKSKHIALVNIMRKVILIANADFFFFLNKLLRVFISPLTHACITALGLTMVTTQCSFPLHFWLNKDTEIKHKAWNKLTYRLDTALLYTKNSHVS